MYFFDKFSLPIVIAAFALMTLGAIVFVVINLYRGTGEAQGVVAVGTAEFHVEVADTAGLRAQGLSGRDELVAGGGMWFVFPAKAKYSFWMKGMRFPLDIVWITDGRVVDIHENVPIPSGVMDMKTYTPSVAVDRVLEVNAGVVAREDIQVGDEVRFTKQTNGDRK